MSKSYRVSADIGGTFTDIVYQDVETGRCGATKILSTPDNPALAVLKGIDQILGNDGAMGFFVHGTTVGLNALLTRRGSKVALVTNENFRDIYTIQGNDRGEIFSIQWNKPEPLASLEHTYTVAGRIAANGDELEPLRLSDLDKVVEACATENYEAIAVSLLFSFNNSAHELAARDYLQERLPGVQIVLSHHVSPEWREFERTSTTVTDAYLAPVVRKYISTLQAEMGDRLPAGGALHVMESNGGVMTATTASETPLQTLLSGPVGGAIGGKALSAATGRPNLICVDMGGTSFDASLVIDGLPSTSNEAMLEGLPIQMSVVDIHVIGAGGGSIAWKEAGALRVGPQSAGSKPGPVCYGLGGTEPVVSDANLVLGRLDGANFSGGEMALNRDAAADALAKLGADFGMNAEEMAQGVIDIVNAKMADAIRTITIQRGIDPREFSLVAFGGAGPAQAAALAEELEISEVIIPVHPGAFSAWGMLQTDVRHDFKETLYSFWDQIEAKSIEDAFDGLAEKGLTFLAEEGIDKDRVGIERAIDFRYYGQEYVLTIQLDDGPIDMDKIRADFDAAYERQYGHNSPENRVEMANIRLAALGRLDRPENAPPERAEPRPARERDVWFGGSPASTAIIDRNSIGEGDAVSGPAIIEEVTSTTLLPPGWTAQLIDGGHMSLVKEDAA
ncbi:hydantoinase/oxoprolinase family protein [Roseobacter sp. HKCCD9010]|uniref:hydantoinase/oxoprolinase family protein n=1 Tax=unclassified Roseobacter TaxID=196798 RepID=UPI0014913211|nr:MULTISPECIES: hydantoinase/oxoprolinase family protein [unclassified Roseobacter]MBF9051250.1 hydantoinase/oxoprolinase family protein [Rhodobacterales bacterium HKCCD4356]NNV13297.1 hydantoinase/oxoprolinase family protein [Roseobacter sp. HKCCD7357]NNV17548.1 hydantoinase/oxoprolinase family protein [Roseobacter sp. HKCCD8768]NNV27154.1 hydantoinase/oxoprolinase family protein [Roseobacter sp. HKCCD8192]NNV31274.1 hydantoinase/oxoprolinase family protein [Roseobacter sp. HKCCD9061]